MTAEPAATHLMTCVEMRGATGVIASAAHFARTPDGNLLVGITSYSPQGPFNCEITPEQIPQLITMLALFLPPETPEPMLTTEEIEALRLPPGDGIGSTEPGPL